MYFEVHYVVHIECSLKAVWGYTLELHGNVCYNSVPPSTHAHSTRSRSKALLYEYREFSSLHSYGHQTILIYRSDDGVSKPNTIMRYVYHLNIPCASTSASIRVMPPLNVRDRLQRGPPLPWRGSMLSRNVRCGSGALW